MATRIAAPFPDVDLEEKSIIEVDTGNANAVITRVVVHFTQDIPDLDEKFAVLNPLLTYGPDAV
jgi:hypothetical protein